MLRHVLLSVLYVSKYKWYFLGYVLIYIKKTTPGWITCVVGRRGTTDIMPWKSFKIAFHGDKEKPFHTMGLITTIIVPQLGPGAILWTCLTNFLFALR